MAPIFVAAVPPALAAACYYLWNSGKDSQLRSMGLSEGAAKTSFGGTAAGLATLFATYAMVSRVVGPLVDTPDKKVLPGQPAAKVESLGAFSKLAGPPMLLRGAALCLGFYAGGRVQTHLSCRGVKAQEAADREVLEKLKRAAAAAAEKTTAEKRAKEQKAARRRAAEASAKAPPAASDACAPTASGGASKQ